MKFMLKFLVLSLLMASCEQKEDPPVDIDNMVMNEEEAKDIR